MVFELYKKIYSGIIFTKAVSEASKGNFDLSLELLNKSELGRKNIIYSHFLLRGYLMFYFDEYEQCIAFMEKGKKKVERKKSFNIHEKKYLNLYANDLINASIIHGNINRKLVKIDNAFDINSVENRLKKHFPLVEGAMNRFDTDSELFYENEK